MSDTEYVGQQARKSVFSEAAAVSAITITAFVIRLYFWRYHPVMVPDYDGAEYLLHARDFLAGKRFYSILMPPGITALFALFLPFHSPG